MEPNALQGMHLNSLYANIYSSFSDYPSRRMTYHFCETCGIFEPSIFTLHSYSPSPMLVSVHSRDWRNKQAICVPNQRGRDAGCRLFSRLLFSHHGGWGSEPGFSDPAPSTLLVKMDGILSNFSAHQSNCQIHFLFECQGQISEVTAFSYFFFHRCRRRC